MNKILLAVSVAAALGIPVWAQPSAQSNAEDPPDAADHAVARVSFLNGSATIARGDAGESSPALLNAPLVTGDRVFTSTNGRGELQFDAANLLRIAPGAEIRMGDLRYQRLLIQIARGLVTLRVLREGGAPVEISTPSSSLRPARPGTYRILVRSDGTSEYTIRVGEAEVFSASGSETLLSGTTLFSRGPVDNPEFMTAPAIPTDEWDRFSADRDRAFERNQDVSRYAAPSPEVAGMEDLHGYGRWVYDPNYGNVWVPTVSVNWTPYRDGRWEWLDFYGWSWVSYEPWGWAPYHYGRWYHGSWGWGWYPGFGRAGFAGLHNYWRPALVGFVGWGSPGFGSTFALGFGNVGWVPLGPHESFRPWYGRGFGGGASVTANFGGAGSYQNARFNAVTGVSAGEFGRGGRFLRPSMGDVARASAVGAPQAVAGHGISSGARGGAAPRFFSAQSAATGPQTGGWRRFDPSSGQASGQAGQAVHISPRIVNLRPQNGPSDVNPPNFAGFGGPRENPPSSGAQPPRYSGPPPAQHSSPGGAHRGGDGGGTRGGRR